MAKKYVYSFDEGNKDIYIMLVGMGVVLLAFISLFWTSQKSMVASVASILVMIIGIFITVWGYNS